MEKGILYIVSTPIGNLEDITLRAIRILKEVTLIAAEDTRHATILLHKYEIRTPCVSYHSYSNDSKIQSIIEKLNDGQSVALISDAGTPGISDPAYTLIQAAIAAEVTITPIPGPSALLAALVASGLPMHHFRYYGFLPLKKGRQTLLTSWKAQAESGDLDETIIFYESPHRIARTLEDLQKHLGSTSENWNIVLGRELTKMHEEFMRGSLADLIQAFKTKPPKGEFVVLMSYKS
ncbi:MAG: 16S rRNA (cytidine(1402)-2'-O)-methyltransferase [Candidatus Peregrinibacteria bacterium]|nr:16S rRNA (cytidine(1402)-2'-O)-methyltransferase [Candidatus Peregrinibacteria bacterium]